MHAAIYVRGGPASVSVNFGQTPFEWTPTMPSVDQLSRRLESRANAAAVPNLDLCCPCWTRRNLAEPLRHLLPALEVEGVMAALERQGDDPDDAVGWCLGHPEEDFSEEATTITSKCMLRSHVALKMPDGTVEWCKHACAKWGKPLECGTFAKVTTVDPTVSAVGTACVIPWRSAAEAAAQVLDVQRAGAWAVIFASDVQPEASVLAGVTGAEEVDRENLVTALLRI